jgi:hypothetical protein
MATPLQHEPTSAEPRQLAMFEDRYGIGSHARLLKRLEHPCVTFAEIAVEFGVTRERVRQWQKAWLPAAPRGRERRKRCMVLRQRRRLLEEPLFRTFYQHIRPHVAPGQLSLVASRVGFRKRIVRLDGRIVFIKAARAYRHHTSSGLAYSLTTYRGTADFIYFQLGEDDYLLMPAGALPASGTIFVDTHSSKYQQFKNTLAALAIRTASAMPAADDVLGTVTDAAGGANVGRRTGDNGEKP